MTFTQQVRADDGGLVVAVSGELDYTVAGSFESAVQRLIGDRRPRALRVDLAGLRFLDSTGVSALVRLWRLARREHCSLRVVNATGVVWRVLDATGALALFGAGPAAEAAK
jgi:anti-sigma B factor antagonist